MAKVRGRRRTATTLGATLAGLALVTGLTACGSSSGSSDPDRAAPSATTRPAASTTASRPSPGCDGASAEAAGAHQLVVGSETRSYQLAVPNRSARPSPLILLFHGFGEGGASIASYSGLAARASAGGYLVASPDGTNHTWQFDARGTDAAFVTALITHLESAECVDTARVYLSGFSAGAAFTIIYSCQHQAVVAAIATVAVDFQLGCTRPMPIVAFHGTADPAVPFANGGQGASLPGVAVRGTELNMGDWAKLDRCRTASTDRSLGTQVTRQIWPDCTAGTAVVLYRVEGGGHTWPGATADDGGGLTTRQISADQLIVAFFDRHPG